MKRCFFILPLALLAACGGDKEMYREASCVSQNPNVAYISYVQDGYRYGTAYVQPRNAPRGYGVPLRSATETTGIDRDGYPFHCE